MFSKKEFSVGSNLRSIANFSRVQHEKSFITSGPDQIGTTIALCSKQMRSVVVFWQGQYFHLFSISFSCKFRI